MRLTLAMALIAALLAVAVTTGLGFSSDSIERPASQGRTMNGTSAAACTQTLSVGADIERAVEDASDGSTICLAGGDYGTQDFRDLNRGGFVTVRSAAGRSARMALNVWNSDFMRFEDLTLSDSGIAQCSTHVEVRDSTFVPDQPGLAVYNDGVSCSEQSILVDGNTFDRVAQATWAGRLSVCRASGVRVSNNTFSGTGAEASDGIQVTCDAAHVTIGPANEFHGIWQRDCDAATPTTHCDSIQFVGTGPNTVVGNYFHDSDVFVMAPDGSTGISVRDNVFSGSADGYLDKIQFGSAAGPAFAHNTVRDVRVSFDSKPGEPASSNVIARDNVLDGSASWKTSNGNGCTGCDFSHNLYDDNRNVTGADNLIGRPRFVGGAAPDTFADWRLAANSPGRKRASDGTDMGARVGSILPRTVDVSARPVQKVGKWVVVSVACLQDACVATASGSVRIRQGRVTRRFKLEGGKTRIAQGKRVRMRLRVSTKARRTARRAIGRRGSVRAAVTVTTRDATGHVRVRHKAVKLTR